MDKVAWLKLQLKLVTSIKAKITAARAVMPILNTRRLAESLGRLLFEGEKDIMKRVPLPHHNEVDSYFITETIIKYFSG